MKRIAARDRALAEAVAALCLSTLIVVACALVIGIAVGHALCATAPTSLTTEGPRP